MKLSRFLLLPLLLVASVAHAAAISTITVTSNVVTVNATAHGRVVNQGVCLSTPASVCAVVATATTNSYTFAMPSNVAVPACASSCGTESAAPRIIVLDVVQGFNQSVQTIHYLLWVTSSNPVLRAGLTSSWTPSNGSNGAAGIAGANNALAAGSLVEVNRTISFPASLTTAQIQVFVQADWTSVQAAVTNGIQPGTFYGSVWDGTSWGLQ